MKSRLSILLSVLAFTFLLNPGAKAQMQMSAPTDIIAKPAFEGSDAGIFVKVWIMSIIRDLGDIEMKAVKENDDDINITHNVLVQVEDENGRIIQDEIVQLLLVTPSGKKQSIDLDQRSDQYGGSVAFTEKGEYQLMVSVNADGKPGHGNFNYKFYR